MKVSENFRKTDEISLEAQFCENQTKNITTKTVTNFRKIFGEFSGNYRQTAGDSYLKYTDHSRPTIVESLSFKTRQDLLVTKFEVQYGF